MFLAQGDMVIPKYPYVYGGGKRKDREGGLGMIASSLEVVLYMVVYFPAHGRLRCIGELLESTVSRLLKAKKTRGLGN